LLLFWRLGLLGAWRRRGLRTPIQLFRRRQVDVRLRYRLKLALQSLDEHQTAFDLVASDLHTAAIGKDDDIRRGDRGRETPNETDDPNESFHFDFPLIWV
jgi:hypothetical protein